ncbi:RICIN domain-containing protein [Lentzea sp. NPDC051838]|uniref:RICIN domain-containing protein n=1 Tax=Lentzea sp. NPDC051838 TaxID=3154849 RepID=UPI00344180AF
MSIVISPASADTTKNPVDLTPNVGVQSKAALGPATYNYLQPKVTDSSFGASVDRCVDVFGNSQNNGAPVILWDCRTAAQNQHWSAIGVAGNSEYGTVIFANRSSGKCLDLNGGSVDNGATVIQWNCHNGSNQRWDIVLPTGVDPGTYDGPIMFRNLATGKCLDLNGGSSANGTAFIQWDCKGSDNQLFQPYNSDSIYG